jgi:hypothetical protein
MELTDELGVTATRDRQRRQSIARAADRIAAQDGRYNPPGRGTRRRRIVLRAERPVGGDVLLRPVRCAKNRGSRFSAVVPAGAPAAPSNG